MKTFPWRAGSPANRGLAATDPKKRGPLRKAIGIAIPVLIAASACLWYNPCLAALGDALIVEEKLGSADILFLLNGEESTRSFRAATLYHAGLAQNVVIASEESISRSTFCRKCTTARTSESFLREFGVPASSIVEVRTPGGVKSTFDEANVCFAYVRRLPAIRRIIVVTSEFHSRRARWIFRRVFSGSPVQIRVAATPNRRYSERTWWRRRDGQLGVSREYLKFAYYLCRYGMLAPPPLRKNVEIVRL
jgi:uncharacterized SAM-binding protein YcdF (DUF218 family)